jgi:hypothetical protein
MLFLLALQLPQRYGFFRISFSISLLKTATIDCPVANMGSTKEWYFPLKSAMAIQL